MHNFHFKEINNETQWEGFNLSFPHASFLQSYSWGIFQLKLNKNVFYLGIFDNDRQVGSVLMVKEKAKRGSYLTIAGGPTIDWNNEDYSAKIFDFLSRELKIFAKKQNCLFIRMRPQALDSISVRKMVEKKGWMKSPMHLTADLTLELNLEESEESILSQMRKNTRYEIRQADKRQIIVKKSQNIGDIKEFNYHQQTLAKKHGFIPFSETFLLEQFKIFAENDQAVLFKSYLDDKLLASAFVIFYNQEAIYHYGISTSHNDRQPGSYACQWEAIKEAKHRGLKSYNFWGIAPKENLDHRFAGVSLFKRGFGGEEVQYLIAHDLPASNLYFFVKFFELFRRKLRKL